jgi:hypothetical protein
MRPERQKMKSRSDPAAGSLAALSILESLLLELSSREIIGKDRLAGVLQDAAVSHDQHALDDHAEERAHREAARMIRALLRQIELSSDDGDRTS